MISVNDICVIETMSPPNRCRILGIENREAFVIHQTPNGGRHEAWVWLDRLKFIGHGAP